MAELARAAPPLVLASGSPTRRALLEAAGVPIEVSVPSVDEAAVKQAARTAGDPVAATAITLAALKARALSLRRADAIVIGADQILVCDERWFDKPADRDAARAQLLALRERTHTLVTAVLCMRAGDILWQHVATPRLTMRSFSAEMLDAYLAAEGDNVTKSVGAYRLEGPGLQLFERIEGDYFAILGLPLLPLLAFLRGAGALPA
ncbi:MAG TPA: Maf family nucleotide pyrophosphatase [Acetobacteraceae bacterium]|nr:Maf family nucleotide pyrophosphatase [Acetobacteraceae bacterium]